jgi:hypothetical protein
VRELSIGGHRYRIVAACQDGTWVAHARRVGTGDRFGTECSGATEAEAIESVARWLDWQHEHGVALDALQRAEQAYHRVIAGSAFANPTEGPTPIELQQESLQAVEAARVRLDEVRARRPV